MAEKKRGRPVKVSKRTHIVSMRFNDEDWMLLDKIAAKTGMSHSNILRAALRLYYSMRFE